MKKQQWKVLFIALCMSAAGIMSCQKEDGAAEGFIEAREDESGQEKTPDISGRQNDDRDDDLPESEAAHSCYVHICGEVISPGVYQLSEGDRVFQAVEAAGGFTKEASEESLNLALCVQDGMKITVLSKEEAETLGNVTESGAAANAESKVNLNTASKEQLMTLNGIGESKADDIIRYRNENGPFRAIEDIQKVSGIKEAAFRKIKDKISV